jgi:2-methylcitrate dehydratase PrpD
MINYTDLLTDYIFDKCIGHINEKTLHQAKRCLLDYIGVVYAGKGIMGNQAIELINQFPDVNIGASVIGYGLKKSATEAAFLNGYISHVAELDDGVNSGIVHPGTPCISALLAYAEVNKVSGLDLLRGIVAAYEVTIRLANAVQPAHKLKGYHATGTIGAVGAAAGIAVMMKASKDIFKNAISSALISSGGSLKALEDASQLKPFNVGNAARSGLTAFLVADAGIIGPNDALGGERGFLSMMSGDFDSTKLTLPASDFAIHDIYIKPYAACRYCHPAIEASIKLSESHALIFEEIKEITVTTYDLAVKNHDHTIVPNSSSGKMSIPFSVATAIMNKKAGIEEFSDKLVHNNAIISLTQKVRVHASTEYSRLFPVKSIAAVKVHLINESTYSCKVEYPKGEPENPLSDKELNEKVISLCGFGGCEKNNIPDIIQNIWNTGTYNDNYYDILTG